ncbi:GNAT family N-acetyltransferase [Shouchella shacheensis]|uniref:GNAT family N-acetyltransferase n=1 Tax=Shouchella shacheensis TaxID=1649580 RepID=UPI00073FBA22|nr:GNAT family N-acetyltransferase [Shouchella shacheensis]
MIRQAASQDLTTITAIASRATRLMNAEGSDQWDETYPTAEHFENDIAQGSLFIKEEAGTILGMIAVDRNLAPEFKDVLWETADALAATFHRLAVDPKARKSGLASELIGFAESFAIEQGLRSMKIDTYSLNEKAQALFARLDYHKVGEMFYEGRKLPFYCYEKKLTV